MQMRGLLNGTSPRVVDGVEVNREEKEIDKTPRADHETSL